MSSVDLSSRGSNSYFDAVRIRFVLSRLLSILAIVGILIAPAAMPAGAMTMAVVAPSAMDDGMTAQAAFGADAMPCCIDEKPVVPACPKSCPMAVVCVGTCLPAIPSTAAYFPTRFVLKDVKVAGDDLWLVRLSEPPPPRPPRT